MYVSILAWSSQSRHLHLPRKFLPAPSSQSLPSRGTSFKISALHFRLLFCRWMATHSSLLAWRMPWTEEPGRLQSMGSHTTQWLNHHHRSAGGPTQRLVCYTRMPSRRAVFVEAPRSLLPGVAVPHHTSAWTYLSIGKHLYSIHITPPTIINKAAMKVCAQLFIWT